MDVYVSFTLYDGAPNRAYSMVLQSMQPVRVYAWGLYCLIVSIIVGSRLASDRVSAAVHDAVFALHQMLSSHRCQLSIMRRDAGLHFSSLTVVPHSKCIDRIGMSILADQD